MHPLYRHKRLHLVDALPQGTTLLQIGPLLRPLCGSNAGNALTWPSMMPTPTFRGIELVEVIAPSRVREVTHDLFAPLVRGGALLLGPKYPRGCTSGRCANGSTGSSIGTGPHSSTVPTSMDTCRARFPGFVPSLVIISSGQKGSMVALD